MPPFREQTSLQVSGAGPDLSYLGRCWVMMGDSCLYTFIYLYADSYLSRAYMHL